jgi:hypothetical protein
MRKKPAKMKTVKAWALIDAAGDFFECFDTHKLARLSLRYVFDNNPSCRIARVEIREIPA